MKPKYPIYIISKGRWDSRLTSKAFEKMNVPYKIVIEPQEKEQYSSVIDPKKILILPFSNLGQGSIPARNWVWEHAISMRSKRHWILDDNIRWFYRLNNNIKIRVNSGTIFRCAEDFTDRYKNVPMSGFNYSFFSAYRAYPFTLNTRIYSCILLSNEFRFRWRGRYNEDTDLSLRILKAGFCTILFHAFLADKMATMKMKGGNMDEIYQGNGRYLMAESLAYQHPDVVRIDKRWGRYQHVVDYSPFKINKLKRKKGIKISKKDNNYGMVLKGIEDATGKKAKKIKR